MEISVRSRMVVHSIPVYSANTSFHIHSCNATNLRRTIGLDTSILVVDEEERLFRAMELPSNNHHDLRFQNWKRVRKNRRQANNACNAMVEPLEMDNPLVHLYPPRYYFSATTSLEPIVE
jgi:hypothetical protein